MESKKTESTDMNPQKTTIAILAALSASLALADDFKTMDGKEYKDATVSRVEPDGIVVRTKSGISKLYFAELPQQVQRQFNYDPQQARAYSAQQSTAIQQFKRTKSRPSVSPKARHQRTSQVETNNPQQTLAQ